MTKKSTKPALPKGRPSDYTPEIGTEIMGRIAEGMSLKRTCEPAHLPCIATVYTWFKTQAGFLEAYMRAKEDAADAMAEEILDIADDTLEDVQRSRLKVDARKWIAAKLKPKKYGDRIHTEHSGTLKLEDLLAAAGKPSTTTEDRDHG